MYRKIINHEFEEKYMDLIKKAENIKILDLKNAMEEDGSVITYIGSYIKSFTQIFTKNNLKLAVLLDFCHEGM